MYVQCISTRSRRENITLRYKNGWNFWQLLIWQHSCSSWELWATTYMRAHRSSRLMSSMTVLVKQRCVRPIALNNIRAVGRHLPYRITCYPTQVNAPAYNPIQTGRYSIYLPRRDGRLSWPRWLVAYRDGLPARRQSPIPAVTAGPG